MNNLQLATADRFTHIKIVAVALVACIAIVAGGKAVRQDVSEPNARMEARVLKVAPGQVVVWTSADRVVR